jgi:hypothetical protein
MRCSWVKAAQATLCWMALVLAPVATAQISATQADKLMQASGLTRVLDSLGPQFRKGFAQPAQPAANAPPMDAARLRNVQLAAERAFEASALRESVRGDFMRGLTPVQVTQLDLWYFSALGQRITALENSFTGPERDSQADMTAGVAVFEAATPERKKLVVELAQQTRAVDLTTQVVLNFGVAMALGMSRAAPEGTPQASPETLREAVEAQRPQMQTYFANAVVATYALTYQGLSDADLAAYIAFVATPTGQEFNVLTMQAVDRAMTDAAFRLGRSLPQ